MSEALILLVEDDPDDAELALLALKAVGIDHRVAIARDGQQALDQLLRRGAPLPALVLLDLKLPKIGGLELLRRIRADAGLKALPVVILTSSDEPRDKEEAARLGAQDYILKSIRPEDFRAAIERLKAVLTSERAGDERS